MRQYTVDYNIPLWRIVAMTVLSAGLYIFYWFYLTWKHYRDSTDEEAYPVWHALTLLVLIYGVFRTHAHMRVYRELMSRQGVTTTISPAWAVAAMVAITLLTFFVERYPVATQTEANTIAALLVISVAILAWLLIHVQGNLNRYWAQVFGRVNSLGFSLLELAITVIGLLVWIHFIALVASESYRLNI